MPHATLAAALTTSLIALATAVAAQGTAAPRAELPTLKVGDTWRTVRTDRRTGQLEADTLRSVTSVSASGVEGTENNGSFRMTAALVSIESPDFVRTDDGAKFIDFPLEVGKKWSFKYENQNKASGFKSRWQYDAEVVGYEKIKVPAGEFDTFKIVHSGYWNGLNGGGDRAKVVMWYAPAARSAVRWQFDSGRNSNETVLTELKLAP